MLSVQPPDIANTPNVNVRIHRMGTSSTGEPGCQCKTGAEARFL
ncbi:hypothetical protein MXAN_5298 [Myxococcus xanthus DK 1622]|uniref:Uncharacterized protein n=1 Tax=Myxococcus xanthus (strain DK1622) TaxID=246197 RepID=Q1D1M4_MYXXD|nr:hypothetical protein MXAN_5298 [Myxococcus xanthus DK 1622]